MLLQVQFLECIQLPLGSVRVLKALTAQNLSAVWVRASGVPSAR